MKFLTFLIVTLLVSGCGYTPSAKFSRTVLGEKISTSVNISLVDPENTVIIKDAVDAAIIKVFHASLVSKESSDTHLLLKLTDPAYSPIQYDINGFIVAYRATVSLNILRTTKDASKNYIVKGSYDFRVAPNAVITDKERFDAIRYSSEKAINAFVARVSAEGAKAKSKEEKVSIKQPVIQEKLSKEPDVQVDLKDKIQEDKLVAPIEFVGSKLDDIEKAYQMKQDGLISDEEFRAIKNGIIIK